MDLNYFIGRLIAGADLFRGLTSGVPEEQVRWRPAPEKWSLIEIVNHMYDEERLDFRKRLDLLLHSPGEPWPEIDPEGWVKEKKYSERDWADSVSAFLAERERSTTWLRGLESPEWDRSYSHPVLGELQAGTMLSSWLAHDYLHARQIVTLHFRYLEEISRPYSPGYAGQW